jgi:5'-3' exonuclease
MVQRFFEGIMTEQPLLYLIDALPYVFRAYFAMREMHSPQGYLVHAVYGFASFLLQIVRQEPLTHIAVAFDESLTTSFRNAFYPAYKANRELPPSELAQQLAYCQAVARALGMTVFVDQQYEADDLIGTLARQASGRGVQVVIVSNDKDLMQLVTPAVMFYDFAKDRRFDAAGVIAHMGVRPEQIPDLLGLQGDAVDNIPGIKGVGAKTAVALLQTFPDLEVLYADLTQVETLPIRGAKALQHKLAVGREAAFLSKRLATIALDAPAVYDSEALRYRGAVATQVTPLFEELGFRRLAQRVPRWQTSSGTTD